MPVSFCNRMPRAVINNVWIVNEIATKPQRRFISLMMCSDDICDTVLQSEESSITTVSVVLAAAVPVTRSPSDAARSRRTATGVLSRR